METVKSIYRQSRARSRHYTAIETIAEKTDAIAALDMQGEF